MKTLKLGLLATVGILVFVACIHNSSLTKGDTSQNSLDWDGVYSNVVPCADSEGIQTTIVLNQDLTYERMLKYLGKDETIFTEKGTFYWEKDGRMITLKGMDKEHAPYKYWVEENKLVQFDLEGKPLDKDIQPKYSLQKVSDIVGKHWKLIELDGKEIPMSEIREPFFTLLVSNNRIYGDGVCNSFNGTYILTNGNGIRISPLASTMMACLNMEIESGLFRALGMVDNYTISQDTLSLNKAKTPPLAKFVAVEE